MKFIYFSWPLATLTTPPPKKKKTRKLLQYWQWNNVDNSAKQPRDSSEYISGNLTGLIISVRSLTGQYTGFKSQLSLPFIIISPHPRVCKSWLENGTLPLNSRLHVMLNNQLSYPIQSQPISAGPQTPTTPNFTKIKSFDCKIGCETNLIENR